MAVDPRIVAAGIAAGGALLSAIMQWRNSADARRASAEDLARIDALYNQLTQPKFDESGEPVPNFDPSTFTPEDFQVIQKYMPEVAPQVAEAAPHTVQETADMRLGRDAQREALQRFRDIAAGGRDPELDQALAQANRNSQIQAQSRQDSILQDAQRRGQLGSGLAAAAQLQGGAQAMDRNAMLSQDAAAEAYRNRLNALRQSASLGGDIRSADERLEGRNIDTINAFNQRMANRSQDYLDRSADVMNQAQRFNIGQGQEIANKNVDQRNRAALGNRERDDALRQWAYKARLGEKARLNDIQQNKFENAFKTAQGRSGVAGQNIAFRNQSTADQNKIYQGLGDTIGAGAQWYAEEERKDKYGSAK